MNHIIIRADLAKHQISRHIYGHFAEHLGRGIYGGFWVGEDSTIPNTRGIRDDIVGALRAIRAPVIRWPGGCFADDYHWMDGIGPRDKRPAMINTLWGQVIDNNHFGTHEFLDLCDQIGCEPYICGNVGSGTVREMQQWVEYVNFDGRSSMADLRRTNGRGEPWGVRFWGIGNENWGCGGGMRPEYYADLFRRYATYLRDLSGTRLSRIACGPGFEDYVWTDVLLRGITGRPEEPDSPALLMAGLSLHYYIMVGPWGDQGSATEFTEKEWFLALSSALRTGAIIDGHCAIMDRYDPDKRIALILDEWGTYYDPEPGTNPRFLYQQNTLRDAVVAGVVLNILNSRCERVRMANIAQTVNVLQSMVLTRDDEMILTPTYHVFEMYAGHQDAVLAPLEVECEDYCYGEESLPAVSASASIDKSGRLLLTVCNAHPSRDMALTATVLGATVAHAAGRLLTAGAMNTHNTFEDPDRLRPAPFEANLVDDHSIAVKLPAKAVVALHLT
jgi:alpha-N-arabinofuranosidase